MPTWSYQCQSVRIFLDNFLSISGLWQFWGTTPPPPPLQPSQLIDLVVSETAAIFHCGIENKSYGKTL